jgi:flagellar basal-body rod protein FlgF
MLEGSNVNPILEITNLIEIQRAYESVTRMIENTTELSRRSVERLGRVS